MIPKINTFTLYLCCGTCYHNSIRFSSYFEALFALYGSSIPSSVLNPEFLMVISNVPVADPGGGGGGGPGSLDPPVRPDACLRLKFVHREDHCPCRDFAQKA